MATLIAGDFYSIDMTAFNPQFQNGVVTVATYSYVQVAYSAYDFTDIYGSFFYDIFGNLVAGTVTGLDFYLGGYLGYNLFGANIDLNTLASIAAIDLLSARAYVFQGNDIILGSPYGDVLAGFAGSDVLDGGDGPDTLIGGSGFDVFSFSSKPKSSYADLILDFEVGIDLVSLDGGVFTKLKTGDLQAKAFHIGRHAHDKNDRIIYDDRAGELLYDKNGSKSGGEKVFAFLGSGLDLIADDFFVV